MFYNAAAMFLKQQSMYDPSIKIAASGYDEVIRLMEMPKCFDKGHHLFTDNLFMTYAAQLSTS